MIEAHEELTRSPSLTGRPVAGTSTTIPLAASSTPRRSSVPDGMPLTRHVTWTSAFGACPISGSTPASGSSMVTWQVSWSHGDAASGVMLAAAVGTPWAT